jgi:hypothetical protein
MPQVKQLVTNLLPWRPGFISRVVQVVFVVDRVAFGQDLIEHFSFPLPVIIPIVIHIHFSLGAGIIGQFEVVTQLLLLAFIPKIIGK